MNWREIKKLNDLANAIHLNAVDHGWWSEVRPLYEIIALIHSELSEALEEYRSNKPFIYHICKSKGHCCIEESLIYTDTVVESMKCKSLEMRKLCNTSKCPDKSEKPEGIAVELADVVIRILDYCARECIDIADVLEERRAGNDSLSFTELITVCHSLINGAYMSKAYKFKDYINPICFAECIALIDFWLEENGINLIEVIKLKHEYNKTRPYRHGGKKC